MDERAILGGKCALTTVQIALGFASCNFPVAMQFFPKSHSRPCDYPYESISEIVGIMDIEMIIALSASMRARLRLVGDLLTTTVCISLPRSLHLTSALLLEMCACWLAWL